MTCSPTNNDLAAAAAVAAVTLFVAGPGQTTMAVLGKKREKPAEGQLNRANKL